MHAGCILPEGKVVLEGKGREKEKRPGVGASPGNARSLCARNQDVDHRGWKAAKASGDGRLGRAWLVIGFKCQPCLIL